MLKGELSRSGVLYRESDYYIIRQSMPYALGDNNAYLMETCDGWAVIDVGVDVPETRAVWEQAIKEIGITFHHIHRIYVTHYHPDHLGAAGWLQRVSGAPVYLLGQEIERAQAFIFMGPDFETDYLSAIREETDRHGFPEHIRKELIKDWHLEVAPLHPKPAEILPLEDGRTIELAGDQFQVIQAAGHADGQYVLWCQRRRHLFSADVVADSYLHFTDWPNTTLESPLASFLHLIDKLDSLGEVTAFPGHGASFTDLGPRLAKLGKLHQRRMERVLQAVTRPVTAGELYPHMGDIPYHVHLHRLVLGETLGYMTYLADQGQLLRYVDTAQIRFGPVK